MYRDRKGNYFPLPKGTIPKKRQSAYGIFIKRGKVLLVQPVWAKFWEFPGGKIDEKETLLAAVRREFLEETGFDTTEVFNDPVAKRQTKFYQDDVGEFFDSEMYFFLIKKLGKQNRGLVREDEIADLKWLLTSELNESNMHETHLEVFKELVNNKNKTQKAIL